MNSPLPDKWFTRRVIIRDCRPEDGPAMHDIFNACRDNVGGDPAFQETSMAEIDSLIARTRETRPDGKRFRAQTLHIDDELVGYFHLIEGEPLPDLIWISMLALHPQHHGQRLGQEIFKNVARLYAGGGYFRAIWLEVYVKNWPAMSFWVRQGFTRIIDYSDHTDEGRASLVLERPF